MNASELIKALADQRVELKSDIRDMLNDHTIVLSAKVKTEIDGVKAELKEIRQCQEEQNGTLKKHDDDIRYIKKKTTGLKLAYTSVKDILKRHPVNWIIRRWYITLAALFILSLIFHWAFHGKVDLEILRDIVQLFK